MTLLEVALHTERIQQQTHMLAAMCCLESFSRQSSMLPMQSEALAGSAGSQNSTVRIEENGSDSVAVEQELSLPAGPELLSALYTELLEADNIVAPMIRFGMCYTDWMTIWKLKKLNAICLVATIDC